MKKSLIDRLSGQDSLNQKPTAKAVSDLVTTIKGDLAITTTRAGVHVSTTRARASDAVPSPKKAAAIATPSAKPAQAPKAKAAAKPGAKKESRAPFSSLMNGLKPTAREDRTADTLRVPEMAGGVATGRYLEVDRPRKEASKLDSSSIASRIIAAAKRAFGK